MSSFKPFFSQDMFFFFFCYTPGIYAEGYIVFVYPFVRSYVCMYVSLFVLPLRLRKLRRSFALKFLKWVYPNNHSAESIYIWAMGTLEDLLIFHEFWLQGPYPGVGLEVKI